MTKKELLELGFIDTSYIEEQINFKNFTLKNENFTIEVSGVYITEIYLPYVGWVDVPNCKTISDLKQLIKLFSKQ